MTPNSNANVALSSAVGQTTVVPSASDGPSFVVRDVVVDITDNNGVSSNAAATGSFLMTDDEGSSITDNSVFVASTTNLATAKSGVDPTNTEPTSEGCLSIAEPSIESVVTALDTGTDQDYLVAECDDLCDEHGVDPDEVLDADEDETVVSTSSSVLDLGQIMEDAVEMYGYKPNSIKKHIREKHKVKRKVSILKRHYNKHCPGKAQEKKEAAKQKSFGRPSFPRRSRKSISRMTGPRYHSKSRKLSMKKSKLIFQSTRTNMTLLTFAGS